MTQGDNHASDEVRSRRLWLAAIAVGVLGGMLSVVGWYLLRAAQDDAMQSRFERDAEVTAEMVQRKFGHARDMGRALRAFFAGSILVERDEFDEFAWTYVLDEPQIKAMQWVVPISTDEREDHEQAAELEQDAPYEITQPGPDVWQTAEERERYFPAYFSVARHPDEWPVGHDWGVDERVASALERSRETGRTTFAGPLRVPPTEDDVAEEDHFLAVAPVLPSRELVERQEADPAGLAVFVSPEDLEVAARQAEHSSILIAARLLTSEDLEERLLAPARFDVHLIEESPVEGPVLLHSVWSADSVDEWRADDVRAMGQLVHTQRLDLPAVDWSVRIVSTPAYLELHRAAPPVRMLLIGLGITAVAVVLILVAGRAKLI